MAAALEKLVPEVPVEGHPHVVLRGDPLGHLHLRHHRIILLYSWLSRKTLHNYSVLMNGYVNEF